MELNTDRVGLQVDVRKSYEKPAIIQELELETRAGSSVITPFMIDPLDND
jgi:hypothetical protein